ncbi:c-type cytochrome [Pseudochrobactrum sp. HB0163]|uniref:c-type cytochrome n=1 Tax=Pseudochrobactrum sp. HB0163 TaxID=3450708 RepID=UPI003F6DD676
MQKSVLVFSALFMMAGAAVASPVEDRQALMKDIGRSMGVLGAIMKGEKPFEGEAVQAALEQLKADAAKIDADAMFPKGSEGGDTAAAPKIWEDEAGFKAEIEKFRTVTAAAVQSKPQDVDALRVSMKEVGMSCGTCHQNYRIKK